MLLGIDQGTTGTRACLVEPSTLRIVAQAYATHAQHQPRPGWIEHDANEIWHRTQQVIREVGGKPTGIAIANQGETVMIWDARTREPLHHALVWQDTRADVTPYAAHAARITELTGLRLDPYFSAPKLRWLLDHIPRARELANAGHLRAGTLDTWLIDRLTNGAVFATDASTAARTLLCAIDGPTWSAELCALFDIPMHVLPEIRDTDGFGGDILASVVDQPAALAGQGCIDRGDAKATFGTGCFVYVNTGTERPRARETLATIAWRRNGTTTYALDGGVLAAGTALDWARDLGLVEEGRASGANGRDVGLAAGSRRDPDVVCVPALVGLGAPHWDRNARAAWLGMSSATTRADLGHAVLDGVACRVVEVVHAIERDAQLEIAELRADGGLTRSATLMQRQADLLGRPIVVAEEDEATVIGACAIAALRTGELDEATLRARKARSSARYEPRISADERGATLDRFARALRLVRSW